MALRDDAVDVIISRYLRTLDPMADLIDELLQAASRPKALVLVLVRVLVVAPVPVPVPIPGLRRCGCA